MPARPAVPNALRTTFAWNDGVGDFAQHICWSWSAPAGGPAIADMNALAEAHYNEFATQFLGDIPSSYSLLSCTATPLDNAAWPIGFYELSTPGSNAGKGPGSGVSIDLNLLVSLRYRGGHFRTTFPPAVASHMVNDREWDSDLITAYQEAATAYFATLGDKTYGGVTVLLPAGIKYTLNKAPLVSPEVLPVTGVNVRARVGSMRRRTRIAG